MGFGMRGRTYESATCFIPVPPYWLFTYNQYEVHSLSVLGRFLFFDDVLGTVHKGLSALNAYRHTV